MIVASATCGETVTTLVVMVGLFLATMNDSLVHTLVAGALLVSPEYTACR